MEMTVSSIPGFDLDQYQTFAGYAAENPDEVMLGVHAHTIWEGHAGESLAKIGPWALGGNRIEKPTRDYSLQIGAWKEVAEALGVQGAHDKLEPIEVALAGLCSCVTWAICIGAAEEGLAFDGLQVNASVMLDPRVLIGIKPTSQAATAIRGVKMDVQVTGDLSDDDRRRILGYADRSPVHALLTYAYPIQTNVQVN